MNMFDIHLTMCHNSTVRDVSNRGGMTGVRKSDEIDEGSYRADRESES